MRESELNDYILELSKSYVIGSKTAPMADEETITRAVRHVAKLNRELRVASRMLDHLLGHPWRIGNHSPCECSQEEIRAAYGPESS